MGRRLYRVPLEFAWPINKIWEGYLNPHRQSCPEAGETCFAGYSAAGQWLDSICRFLSLVAEEAAVASQAEEFRARGRSYPHPYLQEFPQAPRLGSFIEKAAGFPTGILPLTAELQTLIEGLAGKKCTGALGSGLGYTLQERLKEFAGLTTDNWGVCPVCGGEGLDPACKAAYDAWEPYEPPQGPGFQLWTTTNEGAPVSPVFESLDALCQYLEPNVSVFGYEKTTRENWKKMLEQEHVYHEQVMADGSKAVFL